MFHKAQNPRINWQATVEHRDKRIAVLEEFLRLAIDTLTVYASHNPHGPKSAQDALIKLAHIARSLNHKD